MCPSPLKELPNKTELAGLYLHIPFCIHKCSYCDFYSITDLSFVDPFVEALAEEVRLYREIDLTFDSFYFGGGTPSILKIAVIRRIIQTVSASLRFKPDTETTIEVNPGTVTPRQLDTYKKLNFNRLNIGVQSFQNPVLRFLGRIHSGQDAAETIINARAAGFDNIGLDLIYGIPDRNSTAWLTDLEKALEFKPEHLSCYMLTYEPETPLNRARLKGRFQPLKQNRCADLFEQTVEFLKVHGYRQYEVSSFARSASLQSRHNWKYWSHVPYIGLGPSAHSFMCPERYWNVRNIPEYINAMQTGKKPIQEKETLSRKQQITEAIYLGLRTVGGVDLNAFNEKFGFDFKAVFRKILADLEKEGMAQFHGKRFRLTRKGLLLLDSIAAMFDIL